MDTNALLRCISGRSSFAFILDPLYAEKYEICISTKILLEYEEKITQLFDRETAEAIIGIFILLENVKKTHIHFYLNVISVDAEDNKFVDCAFAANTHYLITDDKHFNVLKSLSFPSINVVTLQELTELLTKQDQG